MEVFKIVLKLKMSTNKHRIDGDEEIDVLHDYVIYILSGKGECSLESSAGADSVGSVNGVGAAGILGPAGSATSTERFLYKNFGATKNVFALHDVFVFVLCTGQYSIGEFRVSQIPNLSQSWVQ
jgi:hypothetical protein